jgi:uridylate kinase
MAQKFKRILLKLSGQIVAGGDGFGFSETPLHHLRDEIIDAHSLGLEIGIVIGGGNIFRGTEAVRRFRIERVAADYLGMLATLFNAVLLHSEIEHAGIACRIMSNIPVSQLAEPYIRRRAQKHLAHKRIVIFSCGTGNPFFTTDTAAVLKAIETECDAILKATRVKGIFDSDPEKNPGARFYDSLTYTFVLEKGLKVMDSTAFSLAMDHSLPLMIFNILKKGNLRKMLTGENVGTIVG